MRAKLQAIMLGLPPQDDAYAKVIREMPEIINWKDKADAKLGEDATRYEMHLATQVRSASFAHAIAAINRTVSQEGGYVEDDNEGGEQAPPIINDQLLDPRLLEASLSLERLEKDAVQDRPWADEMAVESTSNTSLTRP